MTRFILWFSARPLWQRFLVIAAVALVGDTILTTQIAMAASVGSLSDPNSPQAAVSYFSGQYIAPTTASMSGAAAGVGSVAWAVDQQKAKMVHGAFGVSLAGVMGTGLCVGLPQMVMEGAKRFGSGSGAVVHLLPHLHSVTHVLAAHIR